MGGISGDNLGEGNCESKIASRQWGDNFCRETSICLAGPSGLGTHSLGPAKTYILRGTPRTYAIKTRAVTDN